MPRYIKPSHLHTTYLQLALAVQQQRVQAHPPVEHPVPMQLLQGQDNPRRIELRRRLRDPIIGDDRRQGPCKPRLEDHAHGAGVGRPAEEAGDENGRGEGEHEGALAQDLRLALAGRHAGLGEALEGEDAAWGKEEDRGDGMADGYMNPSLRDMAVQPRAIDPRHVVSGGLCKLSLVASTGSPLQHCGQDTTEIAVQRARPP
jgi:hypothetical protein